MSLHPAVHNCCVAYEQAFALERSKGVTEYEAGKIAAKAYRRAMPSLSDKAAIRDFIACVAHGMLLEIIRNDDGTKLLYAANVAAGALRQEPKHDLRPAQTPAEPTRGAAA